MSTRLADHAAHCRRMLLKWQAKANKKTRLAQGQPGVKPFCCHTQRPRSGRKSGMLLSLNNSTFLFYGVWHSPFF